MKKRLNSRFSLNYFDFLWFFAIMFLGYGGIYMEQRKSDINTDDGNVVNVDTNGLSYSFDFSSQVEPNNGPAPVNAPEVSAAPVEPVASPDVATPDAQPVASPTVETPVVEETSAEVTPAVEAAPVVEATPMVEAAPAAEVTPEVETAPAVEAAPIVETTEQAADAPLEGTTETTSETKQEEVSDEALIKDKKATKRFLIIVFIIVVAFIIALPWIFGILK